METTEKMVLQHELSFCREQNGHFIEKKTTTNKQLNKQTHTHKIINK